MSESSASTGSRRGPWPGVLLVLVVVLALLAVVLTVIGLAHRRHRDALDRARAAAVQAGRQELLNLDALSAKTLDADLKRVQDGATGKFKDLFTKSEATLRELYPKQQTASTGTVRAAAVVSSDLDTATLLIATDRSVTDVTTTTPALQTSRWEAVMEKHGGRWLLADLEPVP